MPVNGILRRLLDGMQEEYRSTTSRCQSLSFEATEELLLSALLWPVITKVA
jgi:hypothetical protein